jgi:restriction endonuclease Mrr
MQVVIRKYSGKGAKELFDVLEQKAADVQSFMGSIKGLVSYTLARTGDGGVSITICQDEAGINESVQKAKEWVAKNAANTGVAAPEVSRGKVIGHVK